MSEVKDAESHLGSETEAVYSEVPASNRNFFQRFADGFKPAHVEGVTAGMSQKEIMELQIEHSPLKRELKSRHINMIAIGGCIGSGLFIGSGSMFADGGPAGVLLAFGIVGIMLYCTMHAMGELSVRYPIGGSFYVHSSRFLDPSWGFAMGWNYAAQWLVTYPLELIAGAIAIGYWQDDNGACRVNKAAWVSIFYVLISIINIFGVRGYGEAEFYLAIIKVAAIIGFIIFGIVVTAGGGPTHHYFGAHYYHDPGAFAAGFKGFVAALTNAAFAFSGSEMAGLAAAETDNPAKCLPKAIKQVFWRILMFYIVSLTIIGCLVPYNNPSLGTTSDGRASPFVIAIKAAGVSGLPSVFNVVIILATLSVANSSVYGCTRTVAALASEGHAPRFLAYIDREGRPLMATICTLVFGLLGFLAATPKYVDVFNWMLAFSGLSALYTWGSICLSHIRYRQGLKYHGVSLEQLSFTSGVGVIGSGVGVTLVIVILGLLFWVALFPIGVKHADAQGFFEIYLSLPVTLAFYICHKLWYRTPMYVKTKDMDVFSGSRDTDPEAAIAANRAEKERIKSKGIFYQIYNFVC